MITDVSAFVGPYPYRYIPDVSADLLLRSMDRVGITDAWVGHLPGFLHRDPSPGTYELLRLLDGHEDRLRPTPTIHPGLPNWEDNLQFAKSLRAPAVRAYPMQQGLNPVGAQMQDFVTESAATGVPIILTVRFEDKRQRHPQDEGGDLPAAAVRMLVRLDPHVKLLITHADRAYIEEVHFGLTKQEARRLLWDVSWIWGPPSDDLRMLIETVGPNRFVFGTGMPLRIPDATPAKLELSRLSENDLEMIHQGSLRWWRERDT